MRLNKTRGRLLMHVVHFKCEKMEDVLLVILFFIPTNSAEIFNTYNVMKIVFFLKAPLIHAYIFNIACCILSLTRLGLSYG